MPRWLWTLTQVANQLWVRASLIGALGVAAALLATVADRFVPFDVPGRIGSDAVDDLLAILASSMLSVTTFSLSVTTAAFGAATSNVTPRATRLLMEDRVTQNVLSTFVGSFLFSIVGLVVLKTGAYGPHGRMLLFVVTIAVIALIVITLLRWIDHLTRLGRVGETTRQVEAATRHALLSRRRSPHLGGRPPDDPDHPSSPSGDAVTAHEIGYVQHVDVGALQALAEEADGAVQVAVLPGTFVYPDTVLALDLPGGGGDPDRRAARAAAIRGAFVIAEERSFDQDPRFGLSVLSEIASRALSPAVNDPGTAIDVVGRGVRLLALWAEPPDPAVRADPPYPRVRVPALAVEDLFGDVFAPLARDGAGIVEVQMRLQKGLLALARIGSPAFRAAAAGLSEHALAQAEAALPTAFDRARLREAVAAARRV
ncbi:DUF2254 domain-containing protein [Oharaeibacter diazotrophicus]|uniref:Putative membrane protein n=1 Tax=Oharaeibacter diazotrophicus TaxID=1920512 RepID=A0A4R6R939_9HYPH|nr:DUF2254 domain-containing protein [Oharaeibacter diazotrophicus]TDP82570.1 putative membrane protein [Oharaeibacter diazotrophicus]BBE72666.1 hypothetical protein OHA_1_02264 [Pleomorphomonas sp. SM30]GLS76700.1 hypothetical protein GCM10007904_20370 [Oharaeibacter diazotrophicus]